MRMSRNLLKNDPQLRGTVQRGLDVLAVRLEPIIGDRLAPQLNGLEWIEILRQLDTMKGRQVGSYSRSDLQAQLRMLTERLGGIGYPFDNERRDISRYGSELRLVRNTLAHGEGFSPEDAWRVCDTAARLLNRLGDSDGAQQMLVCRDELTPHLAGASQKWQPESASETTVGAREPASAVEARDIPVMEVEPDAEVFERESDAVPTPTIGELRSAFESWRVAVIGTPDALDHLRRAAEKEQVRALASEIVEFEGPIHVDRLATLVARSFGVARLHQKREKALAHQFRQCDFDIDANGFAWPSDIDPASWAEFRPSSDPDRAFLHISPVELANARRFVASRHPSLENAELDRRVLRTFGRKRLTEQFRAHMGQ